MINYIGSIRRKVRGTCQPPPKLAFLPIIYSYSSHPLSFFNIQKIFINKFIEEYNLKKKYCDIEEFLCRK